MNKSILRINAGPVDLVAYVFDKTDSSEAGLCVLIIEADQASASLYATPDELLNIGNQIILAAQAASRVALSGNLEDI